MQVFVVPRPSDIALAGITGLAVWEAFARGIAPLWVGHRLDPSGLIEAALGIGGPAAQVIDILTGVVAFPIGYASIVRPIARQILPGLPWWVAGPGYGAGLWVFAMFVIAHMLAGMPAFLGFGAVAWASLVGHLALGLALAGVVEVRSPPEKN